MTKTNAIPEGAGNRADLLPLLITADNQEKLSAALAQVQGTAYADVLHAEDVFSLAEGAERKLEDAGIAPSYRTGATLHVTPNGPNCAAYKYARLGTAVQLERKPKGWMLMRAYRLQVWPRQAGRKRLTLTPRQKQLVMKLVMKTYDISPIEATLVARLPADKKEAK